VSVEPETYVERMTQTLEPSTVCRSCKGRGFNGFLGHPIRCSRCQGTKLDPEPDRPLEVTTGWSLRVGKRPPSERGELK
jgi:DnaJ-class molecular chaperone